MEIGYSMIKELSYALEMNGRQFVLRSQKINKLKETGEYPPDHFNDLVYYHIKSSIITSVLEHIFTYMEFRSESEKAEIEFREMVNHSYQQFVNFESHDEWMNRVNMLE